MKRVYRISPGTFEKYLFLQSNFSTEKCERETHSLGVKTRSGQQEARITDSDCGAIGTCVLPARAVSKIDQSRLPPHLLSEFVAGWKKRKITEAILSSAPTRLS